MSRELNLLLPRPQKIIPMLVRREKRPGEKNKIHRTALVVGVMKVGEEVQARKFWAAGIQDVGGKGQWPRAPLKGGVALNGCPDFLSLHAASILVFCTSIYSYSGCWAANLKASS